MGQALLASLLTVESRLFLFPATLATFPLPSRVIFQPFLSFSNFIFRCLSLTVFLLALSRRNSIDLGWVVLCALECHVIVK